MQHGFQRFVVHNDAKVSEDNSCHFPPKRKGRVGDVSLPRYNLITMMMDK